MTFNTITEPVTTEKRQNHILQGKKILVIVSTFELGGAERQALLMARLLRDVCGASVEIWGFSAPGRLSDLCAEYGITTCAGKLSNYSRQNRLMLAKSLLGIAWKLRHAHPDILLPYLLHPNRVCGTIWPLTGAKLCVWNQRNEGYGVEEAGKFGRIGARHTPLLIANSTRGAEYLVQCLGANPQAVHVVPNGVELAPARRDRDTWRARLGADDSCFVACKVATLSQYKDHATLLRAWRIVVDQLAREGRSAILALAGRFEQGYQAVFDLADALALNASVRFMGGVQDVSGLLQASDLAVFSSISEGLPNGVLEPMAVGLAVAATDIQGIRDAVGAEGTRYLAPVGDAEGLAEKILILARNTELRTAVGAANRKRIAEEFSPALLCQRTVALIADALDKQRNPTGRHPGAAQV